MRRIPLFSGAREFAAHRDEIMHRVEEVLRSGEVVAGAAVSALECRLASQTGRKHGIAVNSATDALHFSLLAAGIRPGDEVLVTDFSFIASASAIRMVGAKPIFIDVDDTYNMDLRQAADQVTSKTRAMAFVHLYGQMSNPRHIEAFAQTHGLILIEDASQAIGASFAGRAAGSLGKVSCLSFNSTKTISSPGGGGLILTDDDGIADRVNRLRYHGKAREGTFTEVGFNSQLPTLSAAVLDVKLDHDEAWTARRRKIAAYYRRELSTVDSGLVLPHEIPGAVHIYHKFVIRSPRRTMLQAHLEQHGIEAKVHYPRALDEEPIFAEFVQADSRYPNAHTFARVVLTVPSHAFLTDSEVEMITETVRQFHTI